MLRIGSLFSGAGLCDLGLSWAGFNHQWFCEIDPFCRSILARHWPGVPIYENINNCIGMDLPPVDVLCGGFPCQDVSLGGHRAGIKEGTRSGLWFEFARIISEIKPKYVIVENVRGLLSCGIEIILQDLAAIGYDAEWTVLPAAACGAPHHRERVFIVAYPHGRGSDQVRFFAPLGRILGERKQFTHLSDWLGIRFDCTSKQAARGAYGGCVLCRVDDGRTEGMDRPQTVNSLSRAEAAQWMPRLKALGNGIVPHQAYAIGACVLMAEGLPVPPWPAFA